MDFHFLCDEFGRKEKTDLKVHRTRKVLLWWQFPLYHEIALISDCTLVSTASALWQWGVARKAWTRSHIEFTDPFQGKKECSAQDRLYKWPMCPAFYHTALLRQKLPGTTCLQHPWPQMRPSGQWSWSQISASYHHLVPFHHWWLRWWRICLQCRRSEFAPWVQKIPWRR